MKKTQLLIVLSLFSWSVFSQTIIPQKSDTTKKKKELIYFGEGDVEKKKDLPEQVTKDTASSKPITIKYYQATEAYREEKEIPEISKKKPRKNRNEIKTLSSTMSHNGGFGAISFKTSEFKDKALIYGGVSGGWIINRSLAIGVDVYGIIPTAKYNDVDATPDSNREVRLYGGYAGLLIEPIFFSNEVIHVTFPISGGAGWLGYSKYDHREDDEWDDDDLVDDDTFWYIEPGVDLELNVARNFRIALGVTRRFTQDLELAYTESDELDKTNYFLKLKFGSF